MGVDTCGKLKGKVLKEEVLNFIRQTIDKDATMDINKSLYSATPNFKHVKYDDENWYNESGFIFFKSKNGNDRMLFYSYSNVNSFENLDYYEEYNLKDMVTSETTYISLGYDDEAIEIIKSIVTHFGGWIDESDCDDDPYMPIMKNPDGTIKPVYYVAMEEIYEKFGGVVIIKK